MLVAIVNQHVAWVHVEMFVTRHGGDDRHAWKMLGGPIFFLRSGPFAERQAGKDGRVQMFDGVEQDLRVRHFGKSCVKAVGPSQPAPEFAYGVALLEFGGAHSEHRFHPGVEIGKYAVAIEEQARPGQNRAGVNSTGIGASMYVQPLSRRRSLLSRALRPGPIDQVM